MSRGRANLRERLCGRLTVHDDARKWSRCWAKPPWPTESWLGQLSDLQPWGCSVLTMPMHDVFGGNYMNYNKILCSWLSDISWLYCHDATPWDQLKPLLRDKEHRTCNDSQSGPWAAGTYPELPLGWGMRACLPICIAKKVDMRPRIFVSRRLSLARCGASRSSNNSNNPSVAHARLSDNTCKRMLPRSLRADAPASMLSDYIPVGNLDASRQLSSRLVCYQCYLEM